MSETDWKFYIIQNGYATYAGVSPTPVRRLRQHNGEIKGGAKYTTGKGPGWVHICIISGFHNKIQAMQFEWAVKHCAPRNNGGIINRLKKLETTLNRPHWTSKSPASKDIELTVVFMEEPANTLICSENITILTSTESIINKTV